MLSSVRRSTSRTHTDESANACMRNLAEIQKGVALYEREQGRFPDSPGELYPKYVSRRDVFSCPSLRSWVPRPSRAGAVWAAGQRVLASYVFAYKGSAYAHTLRIAGGATPVCICEQHAYVFAEPYGGLEALRVPAATTLLRNSPPFLVARVDGTTARVSPQEYFFPSGNGIQ